MAPGIACATPGVEKKRLSIGPWIRPSPRLPPIPSGKSGPAGEEFPAVDVRALFLPVQRGSVVWVRPSRTAQHLARRRIQLLTRSCTRALDCSVFGTHCGTPEPQCTPTEIKLIKKTLDNPHAS